MKGLILKRTRGGLLLLLVRDEVKYLAKRDLLLTQGRPKSWETGMVMDIGQGHAYAQGHCPREQELLTDALHNSISNDNRVFVEYLIHQGRLK